MGRHLIKCVNCGSEKHRLLVTIKGNRGLDFISPTHDVVICENCGLGFLNPQHDDEDYAKFYAYFNRKKNVTDSAEDVIETHKHRKIQLEFLVDNVTCNLPMGKVKVLDIGSGPGVFIHFMKEYGFDVEGLEPSGNDVRFAVDKLGLKVHKGWIFGHNLPHEYFDIVTSTAVIEHFTNPLEALKYMNRLLKPNGFLFINTQDLRGMVLRNGIDSWFKFVHTFYYTNVTLSSLIQLAGFEIVKTWQMPPILKYSTLLYPENFCSGELNIIARKSNKSKNSLPLKDDVESIFETFEKAKKRDFLYYYSNKFMRLRYFGYLIHLLRRRFFKRKYVFDDFFKNGNIVRNTFINTQNDRRIKERMKNGK